jgi:hypothetical protein
MKQLINFQREVWDGYSGNYDTHKIKDVSNTKTVSSNTSDIELGKKEQLEWETPIDSLQKKNYFIEGFKKGFFGIWRFMGENASAILLVNGLIQAALNNNSIALLSFVVCIIFGLWDIEKAIRDLENKRND